MPLRRLSINPKDVFGVDFHLHPVFANITHLDIVRTCAEWENWKGLALLPKLTHLSLDPMSEDDVVFGALEHCKSLRILALVSQNSSRTTASSPASGTGRFRDDRVVVIEVEDHVEDWVAGVQGGVPSDYWSHAESVIADRANLSSVSAGTAITT